MAATLDQLVGQADSSSSILDLPQARSTNLDEEGGDGRDTRHRSRTLVAVPLCDKICVMHAVRETKERPKHRAAKAKKSVSAKGWIWYQLL